MQRQLFRQLGNAITDYQYGLYTKGGVYTNLACFTHVSLRADRLIDSGEQVVDTIYVFPKSFR